MGFDCHEVGVQSLAATMVVGWEGEPVREDIVLMNVGGEGLRLNNENCAIADGEGREECGGREGGENELCLCAFLLDVFVE